LDLPVLPLAQQVPHQLVEFVNVPTDTSIPINAFQAAPLDMDPLEDNAKNALITALFVQDLLLHALPALMDSH
jgi:hypothetical protein